MRIKRKLVRLILFALSALIPLASPTDVEPAVKRYKIEKGLANLANFDDFKRAVEHYTRKEFAFSESQLEKLIQNGFVVTPSDAEQFFHVYESSHFGMVPRIPNFVTSDCALQLYHLFYDFTLRTIEIEELLPSVRKLTQALLEGSKKQYEKVTDSVLKDACLKNISFFGVAASLLEMEEPPLPEECISEIANELQKIDGHQGRKSSGIFPFQHDYSQYIPRGHYTSNEELRRFFLTLMWYGQNSFPFEFQGKRTEQQIIQALLITHLLLNSKIDNEFLIHLWNKVYSITVLYVGSTDDLNVYHFVELMEEVYGKNASLEILSDKDRLNLLYKSAEKLPHPKIALQLIGIPSGLQFRFMGQRFMPDSYIMQNLVHWPERPWPKGLDVMSVLGSERAGRILDEFYREPEKWSEYLPRRAKLREEFAAFGEKEWYRNLFYGWLHVLKTLLEERGQGYPIFVQNASWVDKELNTALASWTELRHDVILYGKPSGAEGGDGVEEIPQPKGYVEPIPEFYSRLLKLVKLNRQILSDEGFLSGKLTEVFDRYESLLSFLKTVAEKELMDMSLSYEEYERIRYFGREIENLSISLVELDRNLPIYDWFTGERVEHEQISIRGWFEVTGPDRDIACITDVHTSQDSCLEEAVGHINLIYVVVPIDGKLHLTRGGVFSYYEFEYPAAHRLTDESWQEMLKRGRAPEPPPWVSSFVTE